MSEQTDFHGKVIAITGGASGMGFATAKLLASRGAKVSIADVQEKGLAEVEKVIKDAGGECMTTKVDVRKAKEVDDWISKTVANWGKLDGAANLAGVIGKQIMIDDVEKIDNEDWEFVIGVNLTGIMHCLRAQIPQMKSPVSFRSACKGMPLTR
jgi:NAD(P)-dependent dehydrogenase (short-subunit alcohol dehydrogenase family)